MRVEVFSNTLVSNIDFMLTDTSATGAGWTPQVGVGDPAVRYGSEWARPPIGAVPLEPSGLLNETAIGYCACAC